MKYFAYGSNMDLSRIQERIDRLPTYSVGFINDYVVVFNKQAAKKSGVGYANIEPSVGSRVWGLVYDLTEAELLEIDKHEGVAGNHYYRAGIDVHVPDQIEHATTYIAHPEKTQDALLPEKKYLNHLLAAKEILPSEYIQSIQQQPTFD